jgi:hypothetical protein
VLPGRAPGSRSRSGSDEAMAAISRLIGSLQQFASATGVARGKAHRVCTATRPREPPRLPLARATRARAASVPPAHRGEGTCEHAFGEDRGEPARKDARKGSEPAAAGATRVGASRPAWGISAPNRRRVNRGGHEGGAEEICARGTRTSRPGWFAREGRLSPRRDGRAAPAIRARTPRARTWGAPWQAEAARRRGWSTAIFV